MQLLICICPLGDAVLSSFMVPLIQARACIELLRFARDHVSQLKNRERKGKVMMADV